MLLDTSRPLTDQVEVRRADSHRLPCNVALGLHDGVRKKGHGALDWMVLSVPSPAWRPGKLALSDKGQIGGFGGPTCLVERFIRRRAVRAMASLTRVAAIPRLLAAS